MSSAMQVEFKGRPGPAGKGVPSGGTDGQVPVKDGATAYAMRWLTLNKSAVGLSNVDNTSDASKPVSTATQTALDGKAATSHAHAISDVTGLQTALDGKEPLGAAAAAVAAAIGAAPGALDTLDELAAALGDDANFAATVTTSLAGKQPLSSELTALSGITGASWGRNLLALASAALFRTAVALPTSTVAGRLARYTGTAGEQGSTAGLFEDASGNVGIGTNSPDHTLTVGGNSRFSGSITIGSLAGNYVTIGNSLVSVQGSLVANLTGTGGYGGISAFPTDSVGAALVYGGLFIGSGGGVKFTSASCQSAADAGLSRLSANKLAVGNGTSGNYTGTLIAGNIGIGTASPGGLLHAVKTVAGSIDSKIILDNLSNTAGTGSAIDFYHTSNDGTTRTPTLRIAGRRWASSGVFGELAITVGGNGSFGASPHLTLDVNGVLSCTQVQATSFCGAAGSGNLIGAYYGSTPLTGQLRHGLYASDHLDVVFRAGGNDLGVWTYDSRFLLGTTNRNANTASFAVLKGSSAHSVFEGPVGVKMTGVPTASLDNAGDTYRQRTKRTPASATDAGNAGDYCWDDNYEYRCVATNTWQRWSRSPW